MKILIVSAYFYPDITPRSFRTTELVKELIRQGHDVVLSIPYRNYDYTDFINMYPVKVHFFSQYPNHVKLPTGDTIYAKICRGIYGRTHNFTQYPEVRYINAINKALYKEEKTDLLISIAAPHTIHWGVARFLSRNKSFTKKWIADCGDPFMGNQVQRPPFYFARYEKEFCRIADKITIPVANAVDAYYPQFRNKIHVIPQGFDMSHKYEKERTNPIPTFAYAGVLYKGYRDLNTFVDYLSKFHSKTKYKFILYTRPSLLTNRYIDCLRDKIELRNIIQRDDLLPQLANMDFLLNVENRGNVQSPSKLIDYRIANRPVLSVGEKLNTKVIDQFLLGDYSNKLQMPDLSMYDIRTVVKQFLSL